MEKENVRRNSKQDFHLNELHQISCHVLQNAPKEKKNVLVQAELQVRGIYFTPTVGKLIRNVYIK